MRENLEQSLLTWSAVTIRPSSALKLSMTKHVDIQDSSFHNQSTTKTAGSCISTEANIRASLGVLNSTFKENEAGGGGSLFVDSPDGYLDVNLTNVIFANCGAKK